MKEARCRGTGHNSPQEGEGHKGGRDQLSTQHMTLIIENTTEAESSQPLARGRTNYTATKQPFHVLSFSFSLPSEYARENVGMRDRERQRERDADICQTRAAVIKRVQVVSRGQTGDLTRVSCFPSYKAVFTPRGYILKFFYPRTPLSPPCDYGSRGETRVGCGHYSRVTSTRLLSLSSPCCSRVNTCPRFITTAPGEYLGLGESERRR